MAIPNEMVPLLPGDSELLSQLGFCDPLQNALALDAADGNFRSAVHALMQQGAISTAESSEDVLEVATVPEDCLGQWLGCYYGYTVLVLRCIGQGTSVTAHHMQLHTHLLQSQVQLRGTVTCSECSHKCAVTQAAGFSVTSMLS